MTQFGRNTRVGRNVQGGRGATPLSATDPLTIITSVLPFFFLTADLGTTIATGVSQWDDQSGNARHATQATGTSQPTLVTADSDFGGRNSLLADGSNDFMDVAWNPPAPGTTPIWFFFVFEQVTWSASRFLFTGNTASSVLAFFQTGSSPTLVQANTSVVNSNGGATVASAVRGQAYFSSSTSDYTKLGATLVTGASAANSDAAVFRLFSRNGGSQSMNAKIACIGAWAGEPSSGEKTALDAWVTAYYGGSVSV